MRKSLLTILLTGALMLLALPAFAYTRTPAGALITNPVTITVPAGDFCAVYSHPFFTLRFVKTGQPWNDFTLETIPYSTAEEQNITLDLPLGNYTQVQEWCWDDDGTVYTGEYEFLEGIIYEENTTIFIVESSALISIPDVSLLIASIGNYSTDTFSELLIYVLIGVGIIAGALFAVWLGKRAMSAVRGVAGSPARRDYNRFRRNNDWR